MKYQIISAEKEHTSSLPGIERAAAQTFSPEDLPEPLRSETTSESAFLEAQAVDQLWVVVDDEENPVGFLLADVVDGNFHIQEMDMDPQHARQGLGRRLLEHAVEVAKARQFECVTLTTFEHLPWNAAFYSRSGFSIMDPSELGQGLANALLKERTAGLKNRVAMCLKVA